MSMDLCELYYILEKRRFALERKLENKKKSCFDSVNSNIIIETEAKLEEVEKILDLINGWMLN